MTKAQYKAAKALIQEPERWTQGNFARDVRGSGVTSLDDHAVMFCAEGACSRATKTFERSSLELDQAARELFNESVAEVNDHLGHAAVLQMFDRAIELAGE